MRVVRMNVEQLPCVALAARLSELLQARRVVATLTSPVLHSVVVEVVLRGAALSGGGGSLSSATPAPSELKGLRLEDIWETYSSP